MDAMCGMRIPSDFCVKSQKSDGVSETDELTVVNVLVVPLRKRKQTRLQPDPLRHKLNRLNHQKLEPLLKPLRQNFENNKKPRRQPLQKNQNIPHRLLHQIPPPFPPPRLHKIPNPPPVRPHRRHRHPLPLVRPLQRGTPVHQPLPLHKAGNPQLVIPRLNRNVLPPPKSDGL